MALQFTDGSSDRIDCGSGSTLDDFSITTLAGWIYFNGLTSNRKIASKEPDVINWRKEWSVRSTGQLDIAFNCSGTDIGARSANSAGNIFTTGKWWFFAFTTDSSYIPRIYLGDLTTLATEVSYATQTTGSSPQSDASGNFLIGNIPSLVQAPDAKIAFLMYGNASLSLGQIRFMQFNLFPRFTSYKGLWIPTYASGNVLDLTGNGNTGTPTGLVVAAGLPLRTPYGYDYTGSRYTTGDVNINTNVDALTLATYGANINAAKNVQAGVKALTITTNTATVSLGIDVQANVKALTLSTLVANVALNKNIQAGSVGLTLTGRTASIKYDVNVGAAVRALTLTAQKASVSGGEIPPPWVPIPKASGSWTKGGTASGSWTPLPKKTDSWTKT